MSILESKEQSMTFNYIQLRLIVGFAAFLLPLIVKYMSSTSLSSISASYYTEAHDIFVGLLFVIAAVFFAYNGHTKLEARVSKLGALAAVLAALYPTACDTCVSGTISQVHGIAAFILFGSIVYFCLGPFRKHAIDKREKALELKAKREANQRVVLYWICGVLTSVCMLIAVVSKFLIPVATSRTFYITYWAEHISLWSFGIAWLVAGRIITWVRGAIRIKFK